MLPNKKKFIRAGTEIKPKPEPEPKKSRSGKEIRSKMYKTKEV